MEKSPSNGAAAYEYPVRKGPKPFNFWRGIYNKDKNYILGRTPKNWGQLLIFYTCFYIVLGILFAVCMYGLMSSIDEKKPKWTLDESRIGINPGLGFRPLPANMKQGSLIWLNAKNATTIKTYTDAIDKFLEPYTQAQLNPHSNSVNCDFNSQPAPGKACRVSLAHFKNCIALSSYGYNTSKPCIFLKLNRIFNWEPQPYKGDLPETMPDDLKAHIRSLPPNERNQVFVSCNGQYAGDKESIGRITVSPRGFPAYYFPYKNDDGYLSPLVAVQFESPKPNTNINIECIAWATNVIYHGGDRDRQGSIHFELLID